MDLQVGFTQSLLGIPELTHSTAAQVIVRLKGGSDERSTERQTMDCQGKTAVVMDIMKGKTTVAEVARQHDLTVSEVERWIDEAQKNMENGVKARPHDIREQYESELRDTKQVLGEAHLQIHALKKIQTPARRGRGRELVRSLQAELAGEGPSGFDQ